jgi:hypothetical protein
MPEDYVFDMATEPPEATNVFAPASQIELAAPRFFLYAQVEDSSVYDAEYHSTTLKHSVSTGGTIGY